MCAVDSRTIVAGYSAFVCSLLGQGIDFVCAVWEREGEFLVMASRGT